MISNYLLFEESKPTKWRTRVEVYVIMPDKKILVGKLPKGNYLGAGGGVDPGETLSQAAKKECLEELGVKIKKFKIINKTPFNYDFYKNRENEPGKTKGRKGHYRGVKIYYGYAYFDGYDKSIYGKDDDQMKSSIISKSKLIKGKEKHLHDFDYEMASFALEQIKKIPV